MIQLELTRLVYIKDPEHDYFKRFGVLIKKKDGRYTVRFGTEGNLVTGHPSATYKGKHGMKPELVFDRKQLSPVDSETLEPIEEKGEKGEQNDTSG